MDFHKENSVIAEFFYSMKKIFTASTGFSFKSIKQYKAYPWFSIALYGKKKNTIPKISVF